jgi:hypothetical protein
VFRIAEGQNGLNPQLILDVTVVGPRGVGKTSLLAALYDQFQAVIGQTNLALSAVGTTKGLLQRYRDQLAVFAMGRRDPGLEGTRGVEEHFIELGTKKAKNLQVLLSFTDINGELLGGNAASLGPAVMEKFDTALQRSAVIFVAIDTPALMERDGALHDVINKPKAVADFIRDAARNKPDLLVVLVPLKCEKYMDNPTTANDLGRRVSAAYNELVRQLAALPGTRCGVVLTPVQTVGSMVFSRFEGADNEERFRPRQPGVGTYAPRDTDQPLRWMLSFIANGYLNQHRGFFDKLVRWWTKAGPEFRAALQSFAGGCRDVIPGYTVLLPHDYLGTQ